MSNRRRASKEDRILYCCARVKTDPDRPDYLGCLRTTTAWDARIACPTYTAGITMFDGSRAGPYAAVAVVAGDDCLLHVVCLMRAEGNITTKQNTKSVTLAIHAFHPFLQSPTPFHS